MSVAGGLDDAVEVSVTLLVHGQTISGVVRSVLRWIGEKIEMAFPGNGPAEYEGLGAHKGHRLEA
jgi:hypothetical protein